MPTPTARRRRDSYRAYLTSKTWRSRRRRWYAARLTAAGTPPSCVVCGRVWTLKTGHLHHVTYARLGRKDDEDLVPLCGPHHRGLHRILDRSPGWRTLDRPTATAGIIALLRRREADDPPRSAVRAS